MKNKFLYLTCVVLSFSCNKKDEFYLKGTTINKEIETISIASGFISSDFYEFKRDKQESHIMNGKFVIEGNLKEPHPFYFVTNTGNISGLFFLENESQTVRLDTIDLGVTPEIINSKSNTEYINKYLPLEVDLTIQDEKLKKQWNDSLSDFSKSNIRDGRNEVRVEKDEVLFNYIQSNPDSYIGMWLLARNFTIYGYKDIYKLSYDAMSSTLKNTYCGKKLYNKFEVSSLSDVNGKLPDAILLDYEGEEHFKSFQNLNSKFTLIDFWASYCGPCIKDFPNILKLYNNTNRKDFDIVAISIDSKETIQDWEKFIDVNKYPWMQFLDKNTEFSEKLMINAVPANFLLDSNGIILLKNFSIIELEDFLNSHN